MLQRGKRIEKLRQKRNKAAEDSLTKQKMREEKRKKQEK